jgi:hypothetical protein
MRRLAPERMDFLLAGNTPITERQCKQRFTTFLRIAAGLEEPNAAKALR